MGVKTGAGNFQNPLIKENFKAISKESIFSVLKKSMLYFHEKEFEYICASAKVCKEVERYSGIKSMSDLDKLYWEAVLTLNGELDTPLFCGELVYEAIKEKLSTINYGD